MILMRRVAFLLLVLLFSFAAAAGAVRPPKLRLGDAARPTRYAARLTVVPTEESFSGVLDIELTLKAATKLLWLNGTELSIGAARFDAGGKTVAAKLVPGDGDFIGFASDKPIGPGAVKLHVEYKGKVSRKDDRGLFAQKEGDHWYAITQFEAISARRVFPCFDEPSFKTPWQLTVEAPESDVVLSNTAQLAEKHERPGFKTITFAPTKPLPSYLVAVAVGPYDVVDAGTAGVNKIPVRVAAPRGRGKDASIAVKLSGPVVERLEKYFGTPFPFDKLDTVAIPLPTSFGAMENPGMVTAAQRVFVSKPEDETVHFQRGFVTYAAHEFAHQWFGDLVTTAWWDDIWLNESFASWMEDKITDEWHPEWTHGTSLVDVRGRAMGADSLISARKVRQPVITNDEIYGAFDGAITYAKGEVVIAMFEHLIGPETFQRGVRKYIADHANGNATVDDFVSAISSVAGRDLGPAFKSFLDQAGVPLVQAKLDCAAGKPATLSLQQQRFLPLGSKGSSQQVWQIPICAKWPKSDGKLARTCAVMSEPQMSLPLPETNSCPAWLLANDEEIGYYRVAYQGDLLGRLLKAGGKQLSQAEWLGLLDDVQALVRAGAVPLGDALALTPQLAKDPRREVVEEAAGLVAGLSNHLVPDELRPNYARLVQKLFGERARALGWLPRPKEGDDTRILRPQLLALVADQGEDKALRTQAIALAKKWFADRKSVDANVVGAILHIAAISGDRALFERMHEEARHEKERVNRVRLLAAMGAFRDAEIAKEGLAVSLNDEFDARESSAISRNLTGHVSTRQIAWDHLKQNYDAIVKRMPAESVAAAPFMAVSFCDAAHEQDMAAFFKERSGKLPGGPHELAQAEEAIGLCQAYVAAQRGSAAAFLKGY